jgi:glucosamine--fructose-6-phosphate aminotransferase (isomerizing)
VLYHFCCFFESLKKGIKYVDNCKYELDTLSQQVLNQNKKIKSFAKLFKDKNSVMYLGRGVDYALAQEASLKMRELAYVHTQAFPSGELKHGSLALIDEGYVVVAFVSDYRLLEKSINTLSEVKSRGASVLLISSFDDIDVHAYDYFCKIPDCGNLTSVLAIIPAQLLAYFVAKDKKLDIDKPRNLAKSVTVE